MRTHLTRCGALAVFLFGCLPEDVRPPPALVTTRVRADIDLSLPWNTIDGWAIRYDAFLVSIGEVSLEGDACNPYAESDYLRVLDLVQPAPQALNRLHAIGRCALTFQLRAPSRRAVLGPSLTEDALAFLRTPGSDPFVVQKAAALYVTGQASNGLSTLTFAWAFRQDLEYAECATLELRSGDSRELDVTLAVSEVFGAPEPRFQPFARSDSDGDGAITLEELDAAAAELPAFRSLAETLYAGSIPKLPRIEGVVCAARPVDD